MKRSYRPDGLQDDGIKKSARRRIFYERFIGLALRNLSKFSLLSATEIVKRDVDQRGVEVAPLLAHAHRTSTITVKN